MDVLSGETGFAAHFRAVAMFNWARRRVTSQIEIGDKMGMLATKRARGRLDGRGEDRKGEGRVRLVLVVGCIGTISSVGGR